MNLNLIHAIALAGLTSVAIPSHLSDASLSSNQFGTDLAAKLKPRVDGNRLLSPLSASTCLGLLSTGAVGKTEMQIRKVLHLSGSTRDQSLLSTQKLLAEIKSGDSVQIANAVFIPPAFVVGEPFTEEVQRYFDGRILHFKSSGSDEVNQVNNWVANATKQRIRHLVDNVPTRSVVLLNAITFDGTWTTPFLKSETHREAFHGTQSEQSTEMMHRTGRILYRSTDEYEEVELPYSSRDFSMIIRLPKDRRTAPKIFCETESETNGFVLRQIDLKLPKFTFSDSLDLIPALTDLGLGSAFSKGNYSRLSPTRQLSRVSQVIQKTWIQVDEQGTKAAAATGIAMPTMMMRPVPPIDFHVDRPFTYAIVHNKSNAVLFAGQMSNLR